MDTHPPGVFQINGNLGAANEMLKALIQSRWMPEFSEVELLPALPEQWSDGSIEGVHVRGGAIVDLRWKAGKIVSMEIHAKSDGAFRLIPPQGEAVAGIRTPEGKPLLLGKNGTISLNKEMFCVVMFR